jgi:hypothetical protein
MRAIPSPEASLFLSVQLGKEILQRGCYNLPITMSDSELLRDQFRSHLAKQRDLLSERLKNPSQFHYLGIPDFLLREGQFFEPRPLPAHIGYLEFKHCYMNTFRTALEENFVYVEGYAVSNSNDTPTLHAWNLDADGFVVDTTWNPHGRVYLGVVFPLAVVPRKSGKQYPVIDDWEHGYPVLRKAWDGEAARKEAFDELRSLKAGE